MPTLILTTNVPTPEEQRKRILAAASSKVAEVLGKPESYVMVLLRIEPDMLFAGTSDPTAYLELKSLGLPEDQTAHLSAALCGFVKSHFGVPPERVYIEFASPPRHLFGWSGSTF